MKGVIIVAQYTGKRSKVLSVALILSAMGVVLVTQASADVTTQANQTKTLDRNLEPVIVQGSRTAALIGAPVEELYVYKFSGDSLSGPIPAQVDEVTASGSYTTTEDGLLDDNDEIVFMASDLGDQPADTAVLDAWPFGAGWYEIEVTDPLSPTKKGWAYVVRRQTPASIGGDYVDYNVATKRITTNPDRYQLGLAATHIGFDYLTLNGNSTDILDRTKLRIIHPLYGILTEDDLGAPVSFLIKDGPVRVILRRDIDVALASMKATYLAYASLVQSFVEVDSPTTVSGLRTSVDLDSAASGASFYNRNISGGVTVDGNPDVVAATPLSKWGQVSHTTGRLIQVTDSAPAGGTQGNFYCDNNAATPSECDGAPKTGDNASYGDAGILIEGGVNRTFTIESWLFALPPADGGQDNVGATYMDYFSNPLSVGLYAEGIHYTILLPLVFKGGR
jgi:hypothetical protein